MSTHVGSRRVLTNAMLDRTSHVNECIATPVKVIAAIKSRSENDGRCCRRLLTMSSSCERDRKHFGPTVSGYSFNSSCSSGLSSLPSTMHARQGVSASMCFTPTGM